MNDTPRARWLSANHAYLKTELEKLLLLLEARLAKARGAAEAGSADAAAPQVRAEPIAELPPWPPPRPPDTLATLALQTLCERYALSAFARSVLLLCLGTELDSRFCALYSRFDGSRLPTVGMVMSLLPDAHWGGLSAGSPLRAARLVSVEPAETLTRRPLRIDERVMYFLLGISELDARLQLLLRLVPPPAELPPSHRAAAQQAIQIHLSEEEAESEPSLIWLCGPDAAARRAVAAAVGADLGLKLWELYAPDLPADPAERQELVTLWLREQELSSVGLLLCCEDTASPELRQITTAFLQHVPGLVMVSCREPWRVGDRRAVRMDVPRPDRQEQAALWRTALGPLAEPLAGFIERVASQFHIGSSGIAAASTQAIAQSDGEAELPAVLWAACCTQARPHLDELAQRVELHATWEDLILPEAQKELLRAMVAQQQHRALVHHRWGFGGSGGRGLGVSALFVGQSGTGKTLAAEVIAHALQLDLYRIDLSQVVSKYIGETEKNLRRVFDAAEEGGAVLLFDESDALFGKRSEVKDSHDRYANMEVSYLLQRMETYHGVAVLTSNMRSALDTAFLRRLRFIVHFPFPDKQQRRELWRRSFPASMPSQALDFDKLARLSLAGGGIRNIALAAAFLAAEEGGPVGMRHLLTAARSEYAKLERPITEAELGGWI